MRAQQQQQGSEEDQGAGAAGHGHGNLPERPIPNGDRRDRNTGRLPDRSWLGSAEGPLPEAHSGQQPKLPRHRPRRPNEVGRERARVQHSAHLAGFARFLRHCRVLCRKGQALPGRLGRRPDGRVAVHSDETQSVQSG